MSDDLIDRLRNPAFMDMEWPRELFTQCADRIEKLEREKASWKGVYDGAVTAMTERIEALEAARDGAYTERNRLVALLASIYPSGVKKTAIPGWDKAWHGCVYIDTPQGQASWHFHDSEAHLFANLPPYEGEWDGHTTEEKYERIARAALREKKDD
jgi:hypothetical protein